MRSRSPFQLSVPSLSSRQYLTPKRDSSKCCCAHFANMHKLFKWQTPACKLYCSQQLIYLFDILRACLSMAQSGLLHLPSFLLVILLFFWASPFSPLGHLCLWYLVLHFLGRLAPIVCKVLLLLLLVGTDGTCWIV